MRHFVFASLLFGMAACDAGTSTRPESPVINVRLLDDGGSPVDRTQVRATLSNAMPVEARTRSDGTANILVAQPGTYRVWVIPRNGYVGGSDSLSRNVTVEANATAVVQFTVYRAGWSTGLSPLDR